MSARDDLIDAISDMQDGIGTDGAMVDTAIDALVAEARAEFIDSPEGIEFAHKEYESGRREGLAEGAAVGIARSLIANRPAVLRALGLREEYEQNYRIDSRPYEPVEGSFSRRFVSEWEDA